MDCNENAAQMPYNPARLVSMETESKKTWTEMPSQSECMNAVTTARRLSDAHTIPSHLDNSISLTTDQQANVELPDDNTQCSSGKLTWKDLSPTHSKRANGIVFSQHSDPSDTEEHQDKVLLSWGQRASPDDLVDKGQPSSLITWKQVSPTKLSKNAFGFSSPESSDSDTVRRYSPNGIHATPRMQESSSGGSACSPTHGAKGGAGSDSSSYLGSPEDGFSNDYFYDEDFSVKFDTNLKDSLHDVPSEGVSSPSLLEFSDTMTIDVNEISSTIDGSIRASQYESEISMSDHHSAEISASDRDMLCSSDVLQISDGPLFTPTPTNELPHNISTDSLDRGLRAMNGSTSAEGSKAYVDCGTRKELYMLSFFNHKGKQTTSVASVASQASWSSDLQGSRSNSNCTSQDDLEGSVSASLQTHFSLARSGSCPRRRPVVKTGKSPSRSRSESSGIHSRHTTVDTTSTESVDVVGDKEKPGRLTSWRTVKQKRKQQVQPAEAQDCKPKSKSMPDLHMQNWLDKMAGTQDQIDMTNQGSSAEHLKGSATSLVEIYQKMRPDRFSDQNSAEDSVSVSVQSKDSVFSDSDKKTITVKDSHIQTEPTSLKSTGIPPRFYNYSSESESSGDLKNRKQTLTSFDRKQGRIFSTLMSSQPTGSHGNTLPRAYKRSVSSPARCIHTCQNSFTFGDIEKETQYPVQFYSEPVTVWQGTKNFSAQFPPNTRDCGIQTTQNCKNQNLSDKEMQTSPDQPRAYGLAQEDSIDEIFSSQTLQTGARLSRSDNVKRSPDFENFARRPVLMRPHSIGVIGEEEERRFPPYDAVLMRSKVREKRGTSLSPNRPSKQSFYSHRSLPDISFLSTTSPPVTPIDPAPEAGATASPVFYIPRVGKSQSESSNPSVTPSRKVPQHFHPFQGHAHPHMCVPVPIRPPRNFDAADGFPQRHHRHAKNARAESGRKSSSGHTPASASSSSGFSTSSTSSGIDPGYHDNRQSPPMADQFHPGCHLWDSRHKFIETDGGCVYYHSLPNHLPPGFISEEEKMDFYSCMCVKPPPTPEGKMLAYKYERYPDDHQYYFPSKVRQGHGDVPAQDGGQELIPEEQSTSSGMGKSDDMFSVHENDQSSSPDEGSRHESNSQEFCGLVPTAPSFSDLATNGVVLRRRKSWQNTECRTSETDSPRDSSDNFSGGNSSGSSGDDRKPLKSCLRRRKIERRCRSMSLSDPFRLYEGYFTPGSRNPSHHRHSYGCDGYPLYMDYLYEEMDSSHFGDMMEWYRATYMHDAHMPLTVRTCSCSATSSVPSRQESQQTENVTAAGDECAAETSPDETQSSNENDEDSMEKKEKRKSVSFASEVSFHSPLPSPLCSPKHRPDCSKQCSAPPGDRGQGWDSTPNTVPGVPVPQLSVNVTSDDETDASCASDVAPSEFSVLSPRGLADSSGSDSVATCIEKKKVYLSDISRTADMLVSHFSQSKEPFDKLRLGNSVDTPEIGHLVLSQLCPAIARVISDGLKPYMSGLHVFGRIQITVWRVAEMSAELGPSTRAVHELVKDLRNRSDLISTRQKFEAFIFGLLNLRLLDFWMGYTRYHDKVVSKLYEGDSIISMSHHTLKKSFDDMLVSLQPLAVLPFQLEASFVVLFHSCRLPVEISDSAKSGDSSVSSGFQEATNKGDVTPSMKESQPPSSTRISWSWLGGSVSNTLPRAKSLMSNMAQKWSPTVTKLHNGAVRSLTMFSSSSSTSSCPANLSQDFEHSPPRSKGELFIDEGKIGNLDSSSSESGQSGNGERRSKPHLPRDVSDEDSQTESSHGMSKFAAKIFNIASNKIDKITPVYRQGVTEYYFEGDSEASGSPKVITPATDSSSSGQSPSSPVLTWGNGKKTTGAPVPPPKPPRMLQNLVPEQTTQATTSTAISPTKPKKSFGLIKLFDKLLLPKESAQETSDKPESAAKRWSWTPLGSNEAVEKIEMEEERPNSVTTFKGGSGTSSNIATQQSSIPTAKEVLPDKITTGELDIVEADAKTIADKRVEAKKLANQITLCDGPVLTLPPCIKQKPSTISAPKAVNTSPSDAPMKRSSGSYSGIVQSENLKLSVSSDKMCPEHVDGNANFVQNTGKSQAASCADHSNGKQGSEQPSQSNYPTQSTNQHQCTSSHVPQSSANQAQPRTARDSSSSESDQSKASSMDQSGGQSSPEAIAAKNPTEEFKIPTYRYVETLVENSTPENPDHMVYTTGQYLEVLAQIDADWLFCANGKQEGFVQISAVKQVEDSELFTNLHSDFYQ